MSASSENAGGAVGKGAPPPPAQNRDEDIVVVTLVKGVPKIVKRVHLSIWYDPELIDDIPIPSKVQMETFIASKMVSYSDCTGRTLWINLQETTAPWDNAKWAVIRGDILQHLRDFLLSRGVFPGSLFFGICPLLARVRACQLQ